MKKTRLFFKILKETHADKIFIIFLAFFMVCSLIIWLREPEIATFADGMWYCYAVTTTVGFGDITVHTHLARILSVILSVYAVGVIAILTGVLVNYFIEIVRAREKEDYKEFFKKLEHLDELSEEELRELSERIKKLRGTKEKSDS